MNNPVKNPVYSLICGMAALGILAAASNLPVVMPTQKPSPGTPRTLAQRTAEALGLSDCQVVRLTLPNAVERALMENRELPAFTLTVPIRGQQCTLELWPHSVRSPEYFEVKAQQADGSWVVHDPGPVRTVRGIVVDADGLPLPLGEGWGEGIPGAKVAGSVGAGVNGEFRGLVLMPDMSEVWIEPLADRVPGAKPTDYVVYEGTDMLDRGFECGVGKKASSKGRVDQDSPQVPLIGPVDDTLYCAEIAFDVDFEMFSFLGGVDIVQQSVEATVNMINVQYEHQVHITHLITAVLIRSAEPDPYDSPANMSELMGQFRVEWMNNQTQIQRDVAMLFSRQNVNGSGAANISSVCDPIRGYCLVMGLSIPALGSNVSTAKHELGHTWGGLHCNCPGTTMQSSGNTLYGFSPGSIDEITAYRNSLNCLDICGTVDSGATVPIPFFEDFESPIVNPLHWIGIDGATVSDLGINEPSVTQSLHLNGNSEIRSTFIDTSGPWGIEVRCWWQPGGLGSAPGPGESLIIEYLTPSYGWLTMAEFTGDGSSGSSYEFFSTVLPQLGHEFSRIRIRSTTSRGNGGDWFVDDVQIIPIQYNPCPEDCAFLDGVVDIRDLLTVISAVDLGWASCDVTPQFSDGSFGNGVVNIDDIVAILNAWGPCE